MPPAKECIRLTTFLLEAFTYYPFVWTPQNPNTKPPPTILSNIFTYSSFLWHPKNGYTQPPISPFTKAPGYSFFYVIPKVYTLFLHNQNLHILPFSLFFSKSTFTTSHFPSSKSSHTPIVYVLRKIQILQFCFQSPKPSQDQILYGLPKMHTDLHFHSSSPNSNQ